jgi:protease-4
MAEAMLQQKIVRMRQRRTAPLILELDLTEGLTEEPPSDPVSALLTMRRTRLADVR